MFPKHKALSIKEREVVPRERRPLPSHKVVVSRFSFAVFVFPRLAKRFGSLKTALLSFPKDYLRKESKSLGFILNLPSWGDVVSFESFYAHKK